MRASIIHLMYIICSEIERDTREPFPIQPKPSFSFHAAARSFRSFVGSVDVIIIDITHYKEYKY